MSVTTQAHPLEKDAENNFAIAIHGGAGTIDKKKFTPEKEALYRQKLTEATNAGYDILHRGGSSLDAINAAVNILENSPLFNAGKGAVYTYDGAHELDASIMDGKTKQAGAVSGIRHIENPINLARLVMTESVHVMLSGQGAEEFALEQGIPLVANNHFDTQSRYKALQRAKKKIQAIEQKSSTPGEYQANYIHLDDKYKMGTVGAVAVDRAGNIAAATSTGGMTAKRYGRIGDSPIIGAGTWADNQSCAVSATGHGEYFIRYNVASDICARVLYQGKDIKQASEEVIFGPMLASGGTGGVIVVDPKGNVALTFNTKGMYRGYRKAGEPANVAIFGK
ncbi:isoaspartyl peptidase/L-asparaginase [Psychrobium sp. 1_MG-2023]|nr:isoaspartyl peptidase/L-asparaginase [Psychrobium sp. 1_MG-2023]MDP2560347.1 isoaspartyl peptidase/L-asparaginase [Psychrobium sp. 1_MG-2023]PKF55502.1 beta-aspartyl-peptidase [Alteromonadales bacterium alter-6D02]